MHQAWLQDVLIFLVAAGIIVPLFHRARLGAVLAFLMIGAVVGPYGLGRYAIDVPWIRYLTINDPARVEPFAELGVIFLLFLVGLELSLERLWTMRRYLLGLGSMQVALTALAIGAVAVAVGADRPAAVVIGLGLALSSTAIVMQLLIDQSRSATPVGRLALSVLLFQDLMVVPILVLIGILGREISGGIALDLLKALGVTVIAVALIVVAGRFVLRPLLRHAGRTGSRDLIMAITVLIIIAVAGLTGEAGLPVALGAFLAGVLLSETEYRHQIEVDLDPFKGLLLGLFFMTVGMNIDALIVGSNFGWLFVAVVGLIAIKMAIVFAACRLFGVAMASAGELALLLSQTGEFAFVVFGIARANGLLSLEVVQFAIVAVAFTMLATPLLARLGREIGQRFDEYDHAKRVPVVDVSGIEGHVIIGGFGRVGQTIARLLEAEHVPFVALDTNPALVFAEHERGRLVFFGNASRGELLERAGWDRARAFVVTLDEPLAAERMIETILRRRPKALVLARAKDAEHAARLLKLGAVGVIPETVEASLQLGGRVLEALGLPDEAVAQRLAAARAEALVRLNQPQI